MTPVPLDLPLRPSEASELANLIFDQAERKPLTDEVRNRIASRGSVLRLETIKPFFGSLARDPVHPSVYYLAVDAGKPEPLLLHLALATAPTSSIFYKPLLIGRMRRANGPEMVINAIPFAFSDCDQIEMFCARIDTAFLPRPTGLRTSITVEGTPPEIVLPAALEAFRGILKRTGKNVASIGCPAGVLVGQSTGLPSSSRDFYCAAVWAAIRAGWREGYNSAVEVVVSSDSQEAAKDAIRQAAAFSTFGVEASSLFHLQADPRHPSAWSATVVEEKFERLFPAAERGWIFDEFARSFDTGDSIYEFTAADVPRLAVKFGPALRLMEQIHEWIRQTRSALKTSRSFDFELLLEQAGFPATPNELIFCLHWLKQRGHPAQLVEPRLAGATEMAEQLKTLAGIARHYQARLSVRSRVEHTPEVLDLIARATVGRVNYKVSGQAAGLAAHIQALAENFVG
jgi:hypothetical protein